MSVREYELLSGKLAFSRDDYRAAHVAAFIRSMPNPKSPLEQLIRRLVIGEPQCGTEQPSNVIGPRYDQRVLNAIRIIESGLHDPDINLRKVASEIGLSESHLSRLFRASVACGVRAYLTRLRLGTAAKLIIETNKSIKEIAADTGFSSEAHCDHCFKRVLGCSPSSLRQGA